MKFDFILFDKLVVSKVNMCYGKKVLDVFDILLIVCSCGIIQFVIVCFNCVFDGFEIVVGSCCFYVVKIVVEEWCVVGDMIIELMLCVIFDEGDDVVVIEVLMIENMVWFDFDEVM